MKPVMQTRLGIDPEGPGNCFSACVASIFEVPLSDLPDEAAIVAELKREHHDWASWADRVKWNRSWGVLWQRTQDWLGKRGLFMLEVAGPFLSEVAPATWSIVSAESPRGFPHSCVAQDLRLVHDPHPAGGGVSEADRTHIFFVALDPKDYASGGAA